jgi:tetratricopeptide (TPR) repeat protein
MPDTARLRLGLAPRDDPLAWPGKEEGATKRRTALSLSAVAAISPETLLDVLRDSAGEAMEFTRAAAVSAVGAGTLDHLAAVVIDLDRSHWVQPLGELFVVARAYRQRVEQLIQGRHTLKEARELYVYAAWLSERLAYLAHDLGAPLTAEAYAIDCYEHADQAGHDELCAWAAHAMSTIAMYTARPGKAVMAARKGVGKISNRHPLAVALRAQAARGCARQGQRAACVELLAEAQELHERLPARPLCRLSDDTGLFASHAITAYPASSYIWLADYKQAETHARTALAVHESAAPTDRTPIREAIARIDLGIALTHLGSLDEAAAHGSQALSSIRSVDSVLSRAGELDNALMTSFPQEPITQSFHEQYLHLTTQSTENTT